jgi:uncharacterized Zn-binding protein involved in type VI secretion
MGQLAVRETDALSTGHICDTETTLDTPTQGTVYIEGLLGARVDDPTVAHAFPPSPPCAPHVANVNYGSPTVYIEGKRVGYLSTGVDDGAMTGSASTVYVATNREAIALDFGIQVFARSFTSPDFPNVEVFSGEVVVGKEVEEAAGIDPKINEATEYGDGGIATEGTYNNTSPVNNVEGPQPTPEDNTNTNPDASEAPGLNFLPHTDPRILPELRTKLESVAATVGRTLTITSAYRAPEYNASVGGAKDSMHTQGKACDVVQTGWTVAERQSFISACASAGITGFGVYNTFTHVDIGNKRAWGSTGSRTSLPRYPWAQAVLGPLGYATS